MIDMKTIMALVLACLLALMMSIPAHAQGTGQDSQPDQRTSTSSCTTWSF